MNGKANTLSDGYQRAMKPTGTEFVGHMKRKLGKNANPVTTRTGSLAGSFNHEILEVGPKLGLAIFSAGSPYARIQELGGKIKPVQSKFLTVPLPDAKRGGLAGSKAADYDGESFILKLPVSGKTPKDMKPFGSWFIVRPGRGGLEFLFQLRKQVKLKGGMGFFDLWHDWGKDELMAQLRRSVKKAMKS